MLAHGKAHEEPDFYYLPALGKGGTLPTATAVSPLVGRARRRSGARASSHLTG